MSAASSRRAAIACIITMEFYSMICLEILADGWLWGVVLTAAPLTPRIYSRRSIPEGHSSLSNRFRSSEGLSRLLRSPIEGCPINYPRLNDPLEGIQELAYTPIYVHLVPSSDLVDLSTLCLPHRSSLSLTI